MRNCVEALNRWTVPIGGRSCATPNLWRVCKGLAELARLNWDPQRINVAQT
jgi:hypothetical protein